MFFLGNCLVHWISRHQNRCANSTCESEILSIQEGVFDAEYLKSLLTELHFGCLFDEPVRLFNDNQGDVKTVESCGKFGSNRHYRVRVGTIRDAVRQKLISVEHLTGEQMRADLLTKALSSDRQKLLLALCDLGPRAT